jgi:hypothetical protein
VSAWLIGLLVASALATRGEGISKPCGAMPCQENIQSFYEDAECTILVGERYIYCNGPNEQWGYATTHRRTTWSYYCYGCGNQPFGSVTTTCPW